MRAISRRTAVLWLAAAILAGCNGADATSSDGGKADGGPVDGGSDAGPVDGGPDGGAPDAGPVDGGPDAGPVDGGGPDGGPALPVRVVVTPASVQVAPGGVVAFHAEVTGASDTDVTWTVSSGGGAIDRDTGRYTAPAEAGSATVQAQSHADPAQVATAAITIQPFAEPGARPRLWLTPTLLARLRVRRAAADPVWLQLKARADELAAFTIFKYQYATRTQEPDGTIFYDYQGEGWFEAAVTLGLAFQIADEADPARPKYLAQLLALADELVRAEGNPGKGGLSPLRVDSYFPTRFLGPAAALIYDWAGAHLADGDAARPARLRALMITWFDDLRAHAYQIDTNPTGNYFGGHLFAAGMMGLALAGDSDRAQELIDFARVRFDGTKGAALQAGEAPQGSVRDAFEGGLPAGQDGVTGAPFKGGFDFQGWAYGTGEYDRLIDYLAAVKSATGEDLAAQHPAWLPAILRAQQHALLPDGWGIDPSGDWGGDYGPVILRSLPLRLSAALAGTADGPAAQWFYESGIAVSSMPTAPNDFQRATAPEPWERLLYEDASRPAQQPALPTFYSAYSPAYRPSGAPNGALPYFLQRTDWSTGAVWSSVHQGAAFYDDHQHRDAGAILLQRGGDRLLVDASSWKGPAGGSGLYGSSTEQDAAGNANTLFVDDLGDVLDHSEAQYLGGQGFWGADDVVAAEQADDLTFVRAELTSAWQNPSGANALRRYARDYLFLRPAGAVVVLDQVSAKVRAQGPQYRKHLRWHFPAQPAGAVDRQAIAGGALRVDQGGSSLYLDALLPAAASLLAIDESNNPDPCALDQLDAGCKPYDGTSSGTWRVEVADPSGASDATFLTVLQPAAVRAARPITSLLASRQVAGGGSEFVGARLGPVGAETAAILFNADPAAIQQAPTAVHYTLSAATGVLHVIAGLAPGGVYRVVRDGSDFSVELSPTGTEVASAAGVLRFVR